MPTKGNYMMLRKASAVFVVLAVGFTACGSDKKTATTTAPAVTTAGSTAATTAGSTAESTAASTAGSTTGDSTPSTGGGTGKALVVGTDLPLQGASKDASDDTNLAIDLLLKQAGGKAGDYTVTVKHYDDSTAAKGGWDDATCAQNANDHVANADEVAVMGTYNSGCAKIEVPVLNADTTGPMFMFSHANTNPGLTKAWDPGEPDKYYPSGVRNYGRIVATDDLQGTADAEFAAKELKVTKCVVLNDAQTYGVGVAEAFAQAAADNGIEVVATSAWDAKQPNYTALFEGFKDKAPDCIFLGGINDNNGEQLIRDKVAVFGANTGAVKLIAPDGFTGYPTVDALAEADGMYISFAGLPAGELIKAGGAAGKFVEDFKSTYGHDPASAYSIYGAAAMQFIMAAIAKSDGTRK
ncbi:MAG: branched-chain amino acid transport system substrate-binding protein, partial [Acidimicrobiales bacterium]|nr:branched-chain amino acid transport system substrate-binding protein [Acidimicrobiales bacterium]